METTLKETLAMITMERMMCKQLSKDLTKFMDEYRKNAGSDLKAACNADMLKATIGVIERHIILLNGISDSAERQSAVVSAGNESGFVA